ncbi:MAG: type II secretion system protein [Candidatus Yanofskybacteria bacterium]|nr:type II secretion system protein [Candidatus Yanofskybacteria bacterium]
MKKKAPRFDSGFTLVEMLIVIAISSILTGSLILTFSRARNNLSQSVSLVVSEIRDTQNKALSGIRYQHTSESFGGAVPRCGYGITPAANVNNRDRFRIYAGPNALTTNCTGEDTRFANGTADKIVRAVSLPDANVEFKDAIAGDHFYDVFFVPPQGETFIDNIKTLGASATNPGRIILGPIGVDCTAEPTKCRLICVYTSGKIELPNTLTCPGI